MALRIAIDASRATKRQPTGTEKYALRLIQELIQANDLRTQPFQLSLYFRDRPPEDLFAKSPYVSEIVIPFPRLWTQLRWATALWRARPDITFAPAHTLPILFPGPAVATIHDLGYKHFPDAHGASQRAYLDLTTRFSAARAALVFADSQATAKDLSHFYGTSTEKIHVVLPGVNGVKLACAKNYIEAVRARYQLPARYFAFIGTLQPRKNIKRLIEAFCLWRAAHDDRETELVLAGAKGWLFDDSWLDGAEQVHFTGYIDEADKGGLLAGGDCVGLPQPVRRLWLSCP